MSHERQNYLCSMRLEFYLKSEWYFSDSLVHFDSSKGIFLSWNEKLLANFFLAKLLRIFNRVSVASIYAVSEWVWFRWYSTYIKYFDKKNVKHIMNSYSDKHFENICLRMTLLYIYISLYLFILKKGTFRFLPEIIAS